MASTHPVPYNNPYRGRAPGTQPFRSEPLKSPVREFWGQVQWAWVAILVVTTFSAIYLGYLAVSYTS